MLKACITTVMICTQFENTHMASIEHAFKQDFYGDNVPCPIISEGIIKKLQLSSSNLQFVFGETEHFPFGKEISEFDDKECVIYTSSPHKMVSLFEKYFKQANTVFVFRDNNLKKWFLYEIDDVISIICESCTWKLLENGRMRGFIKDKKNYIQYITYEMYHGEMFFGISRGKENRFNEFLKSKIVKYERDISYEFEA